MSRSEPTIKYIDNREWQRETFPALQAKAEEQGISVSDLLRKILYDYYSYVPRGKRQMGDMYYSKWVADPGMWELPVERDFWLDYFDMSIIRRRGGLRQKYNAAAIDPIVHFLTGEYVICVKTTGRNSRNLKNS